MVERLNPSVSVDTNDLSNGERVTKNSAALFVFAVLTKGAGLIVAMLVARYLGPAALGIYAVVMGFALLVEHIAPLGQQFVVVREVARDRTLLFTYWLNTSLVTLVSSLVLGITLVVIVHLVGYSTEILTSVYIVVLYLPVAGLYAIAQAVVQGLEQMEYLSISAFIGRLLSLLVLWFLLELGVGVVAAFIGYGIFQFVGWLVLSSAILRAAGRPTTRQGVHIDLELCRTTLRVSYPFAIQILLMRALLQVNVLVLSTLVAMETIGMFDAADRLPQTSAMIIPIVTLAILPTLSRTYFEDREKAIAMLEKALKFLYIVVLPFVFIVTIAADQIIPLLYGPGYEAAIPVLRVVIWAQVFFVADAVLNQFMVASNNETPMVRRTALSLFANVILLLVLAPRYLAIGAAWAVVITRALNLGLDAGFVGRHIKRVNLVDTIGRPLLCAALTGIAAFVLQDYGLWILLILSTGLYLILLLVFRVFSPDEILLVRHLSTQLWQRVVALRR